ncbi:MAG: rhodanese-like domain-containing protein [Cyclobacteriaceae bacterium]|nr:rhodanese-like domain-containing protein [Cyclobacteriaceae bacterium]
MSIETMIKTAQATIVDVRTPAEFAGGNVVGSINIPLHEIPQRVEEFKSMQGPIVLCCASGNRSGQATAYLKSQGLDCENGGSWFDVNYYKNN